VPVLSDRENIGSNLKIESTVTGGAEEAFGSSQANDVGYTVPPTCEASTSQLIERYLESGTISSWLCGGRSDGQFFKVVGSRSKSRNCVADDEADARRWKRPPREAKLMISEKIHAAFEATASGMGLKFSGP
jgi:hypothetical protein